MPNGGKQFEDMFGFNLFEDMKVTQGTPLYYRAINRMSKGTGCPRMIGSSLAKRRSSSGRIGDEWQCLCLSKIRLWTYNLFATITRANGS